MGDFGDAKYVWVAMARRKRCKGARLDGAAEQSNRKKYNNSTINCVATMDKDEGGDVKEDT